MARSTSSVHMPFSLSLILKGEAQGTGASSPPHVYISSMSPSLKLRQEGERARSKALELLMERMSLSHLKPCVTEDVATSSTRALAEHELSSEEGKSVFKSALAAGSAQSYFPLAQQLVTQVDAKVCVYVYV